MTGFVSDLIGGNRYWYKNGFLHHIEYGDGTVEYHHPLEEWYPLGLLHRIDGPAVYGGPDNKQEWWIMGVKKKSINTYMKALKMSDEDKVLFLLKWGK